MGRCAKMKGEDGAREHWVTEKGVCEKREVRNIDRRREKDKNSSAETEQM